MKKKSIFCFTCFLMIFAGSLRANAADVYVSVDYFYLSPNPVTIKSGDTVYWVEDSSSVLGPYVIDGPWGMNVTPSGIQFNVPPGSYNYTASSAFGGGGWPGTVMVLPNFPPSVSISNPTNGAVFTAPANFSFDADASDPDPNDLSDVEFWLNNTKIDDVFAFPYTTMVTNLASGTYTLKAIAWDYSGATATNTVNIQVVSPPPITLGSASVSGGQMVFAMNGMAAGTTNVLECSSNLVNWDPVLTNISDDGTAFNVTNHVTGPSQFFRVKQVQ